jgi:hypothetical protein
MSIEAMSEIALIGKNQYGLPKDLMDEIHNAINRNSARTFEIHMTKYTFCMLHDGDADIGESSSDSYCECELSSQVEYELFKGTKEELIAYIKHIRDCGPYDDVEYYEH